MTVSDHVRVVLDQVQTKLTGTYLCEVTVTPTFFALAESANMTIIGEIVRPRVSEEMNFFLSPLSKPLAEIIFNPKNPLPEHSIRSNKCLTYLTKTLIFGY